MKKNIFILILISSFAFIGQAHAEPDAFKIQNGEVYYSTGHDKFEILEGATPDNFKILDTLYAKDANNAFFFNKIVENADVASFEALNRYYAKDKNNIYYNEKRLIEADRDTFLVLSSHNVYAKDKNNIFNWGKIINNADVNSFEILNYYAKDKNNVYNGSYIVNGADVNSFEELKDEYGKDKEDYFFNGKKITILSELQNIKKLERNNFVFNLGQYKGNAIFNKQKGKILLTVEKRGEAYYLNPNDYTVNFLGRPADAFSVMQEQGVGVTNENLEKIPVAEDYCPSYNQDCDKINKHSLSFATEQKGRILLQVQEKGEAWYVSPGNGKRYFLGRPADAFQVMRNLGLGISNSDFVNLQKW